MLMRFNRLLIKLESVLSAGLLAALLGLVSLQVLSRHIYFMPMNWTEEIARYTMIWLTFLGSGLALREGAHVAISNAQEALPGPAQYALRWGILLLLFGFFAFMVWVGIDYMNRMAIQKSAALRLPMKWVYAAMPAGFALMILHLALIAPRYLRAGFAVTDEAARG